jgi:6-phosphogluconolactonase (cycloisomerase 2 family)
MKFKKQGRIVLAAAVSAGMGLGLLSCAESNTIDYLYLLSTKNNPGQINAYWVDSQTGRLAQIADSPYSTLGRDPVGIAMAPNGKTVYVIDQIDNVIQPYGIGTDAKLYALGQSQVNTPGTEPVAIGINQAGTFLFVVDIYQPGFSNDNPGAGAIVVYPILSSGLLGAPVSQAISASQSASYYPIGNAPTAITVRANTGSNSSIISDYIYVTDQLTGAIAGCGAGAVLGFSVGAASTTSTTQAAGVLAQVPNSPYCAGTTPSAVASTAPPAATTSTTTTTTPATQTVNALYVADSTQNALDGFTINGDGSLTPFASTIPTGSYPDSIAIDATNNYLYVANRSSNNLLGYTIAPTGTLTNTGSYATAGYPECVIIDPNENRYLYTADFEGSGSTGYQIDPTTGALTGTEDSPYTGTGQATCLAATPHNKKTS